MDVDDQQQEQGSSGASEQCDLSTPMNGFFQNGEMQSGVAIPLPCPPSLKSQNSQQPPPTSTDIDIDSLLLQQFSCMGTTDHEDLINQFQSLMNNQMNKDSAQFFLEMSNWNLQTAVGCYLDYCNFQALPSMKIIQESRPSEYQQAWRLQNDGTESWPSGCYLMSPSQTRRIEMPIIHAGETCDILAEVPSSQPATMWRLCTPNGWYFGETILYVPPGNCHTQAELTERMSRSPVEDCSQVNIVISVNME